MTDRIPSMIRPFIGPAARIVARYVAGGLVTIGLTDSASAQTLIDDPEVVAMIGFGLAALVEVIYGFAKRRGWAT